MPKPTPGDTGHEAGWDRDRDGRMADHAAPDDTVPTVVYEPDADAEEA